MGDCVNKQTLEEIADLIVARMELAVVQRVPRALLELIDDNSQSRTLLYGTTPPNEVMLRVVRRGDVLVLAFEHYNGTIATFRFEPPDG